MRPIRTIARDIVRDMRAMCAANPKSKPAPSKFYAAWPYLNAMMELETVRDSVGYDNGASIVRYRLSNLAQYRGGRAAELKAELKAHLS